MLLTIEKLIYGGDGLARGPEKAVFVPFVLEGEAVEAEVIEQRPGFARAKLEKVAAPSPQRIEPECPYFQRCGGCHYQHTSYESQLAIKTAILRETLRRTGKLEWTGDIAVHASAPWNYRNRTRMRVVREPGFSLAYFRFNSHEPIAIAECPISSPLINRTIKFLTAAGSNGLVPAAVQEVEFFANAADDEVLVELYCGGLERPEFERFVSTTRAGLPEAACIAAFRECDSRAPQASVSPLFQSGDRMRYRTAHHDFLVSPGAFFQTNRHLTDELIAVAIGGRSGRLALDLYAGVGLFSVSLARSFEQVIAVEAAPTSARDLKRNAPANVTPVAETVERYLASSKSHRVRPDFVIVDPPRSGLGERVARQLAARGAARVTYVSCDPATLARDLRVLLAGGYRVEQIHLVDLFPQTFHIETVSHLARHNDQLPAAEFS